MKNWVYKIVLAVGMTVIMMGGAAAFAQTPPLQPQAQPQIQPQTQLPQVQTPSAPVYGTLTYPELFALAWAGGAYDKTNPAVVDGFLQITQCQQYESVYSNEFEWRKIRAASQEQLDATGKALPRYYEYVQPLYLGRYDVSAKGFPVADESSYKFVELIQIAQFNLEKTPCYDIRLDPRKYPSQAVLKLASPFSLTLLRVSEEAAKQYVQRVANKTDRYGHEMRQAYARFRVRVDAFSGIKPIGQDAMYMFQGKLIQLDVFEDRNMTSLLYSQGS